MEKTRRDFKGVWIPKVIYLNKELTPTEKLLIAEIDSLDSGKGCYASNEHFADQLNVTLGALKNNLTKLEKRGVITRHKAKGKRYISINKRSFLYDPKNDQKSYVCDKKGNIDITPYKVVKEQEKEHTGVDVLFDQFWKEYPRKTAKPVAKKGFIKKVFPKGQYLKEVFEKIMTDIPARKKHDEQWQKDNGAYIPHPATYLNQERYNDEWILTEENNDVTIPKAERMAMYENYNPPKRKKRSEVKTDGTGVKH